MLSPRVPPGAKHRRAAMCRPLNVHPSPWQGSALVQPVFCVIRTDACTRLPRRYGMPLWIGRLRAAAVQPDRHQRACQRHWLDRVCPRARAAGVWASLDWEASQATMGFPAPTRRGRPVTPRAGQGFQATDELTTQTTAAAGTHMPALFLSGASTPRPASNAPRVGFSVSRYENGLLIARTHYGPAE